MTRLHKILPVHTQKISIHTCWHLESPWFSDYTLPPPRWGTVTRARADAIHTKLKGEAELLRLSQGRAAAKTKISKLRVVAGGETVAKKGRRSGNKQELLKISKLSGFKPLKFPRRAHARRTEQAQLIL
jgi:hypothetical protein